MDTSDCQPNFAVMTYTVIEFRVTRAGTYDFRFGSNGRRDNQKVLLYVNAFDPDAPMRNVLTGDDCAGRRAFSWALNTGSRYFLVMVGGGDDAATPFPYAITGVGRVVSLAGVLARESEHLEQMVAGLAVLLATSRRKSASKLLGRPISMLRAGALARGVGVAAQAAGAGGLEHGPCDRARESDADQLSLYDVGDYQPIHPFLRQAG